MSFEEQPLDQEKVRNIGLELMDIFNEERLDVLAEAIKFMLESTQNRMKIALKQAGITLS